MTPDPVAAGLMVTTGVLWLLVALALALICLVERDEWRLLIGTGSVCVVISLWCFEAASHLA